MDHGSPCGATRAGTRRRVTLPSSMIRLHSPVATSIIMSGCSLVPYTVTAAPVVRFNFLPTEIQLHPQL